MILSVIWRAGQRNGPRLRTKATAFLMVALLVALATACGSSKPHQTLNGNALPVVTTIDILADLTRNLGGDLVDVTALVPPGAEVHSYQSTPEGSVAISRAALVISNGGELDRFLDPLIRGSMPDGAVQVVAAEPLLDVEETDPHFWQNPLFTIKYAEQIRDGLAAADPQNSAVYQRNFESYKEELIQLDSDIASILSTVDESRRHLVTFHDAFGHFGRRYGWEVTAFVASDGSEVSPRKVVEILEQIRSQGIPAVFAERQFRADVLENTAREAGIETGVIYADAMDSDVTSYIDMMLFNANNLARLLR